MGVVTNRDEWVYDFGVNNLHEKVRTFIDSYETTRAEYGGRDVDATALDTRIKWTRDLKRQLRLNQPNSFEASKIRKVAFRPFTNKSLYFSQNLNEMQYQLPSIFPNGSLNENKIICFCVNGKDFYALAADKVVDLHFTGDTQCLPLYRYTDDGEKVSNITDWGIQHINNHYRKHHPQYYQEIHADNPITPEDIFAYTYAVLHDPTYRHEYKNDLLREFPRLPLHPNFNAWANIGAKLLDLHINFESANPYPLERLDKDGVVPQRAILRADKEKGIITIDERTSISGIPDTAWNYRLGSRSALEWILDQYKERTPRDPTIRQRFNKYRFANHKEKVITLLQRVSTISIKTTQIINNIPHTHHNKPQPKPSSESPLP